MGFAKWRLAESTDMPISGHARRPVRPSLVSRPNAHAGPFIRIEVNPMQALEQMPIVLAAIQYSLAYMLCGGGVVGAVGVYAVAKMLGR
jgi:hypothetical protein